jgi:hypothetical protein
MGVGFVGLVAVPSRPYFNVRIIRMPPKGLLNFMNGLRDNLFHLEKPLYFRVIRENMA